MATAIALPNPSDPNLFKYGYRERSVVGADGVSRIVRIPLTLKDLLHPEFGDVAMDSSLHSQMCDYLASVFRASVQGDPTALVFTDVGIFWHEPEFSHHSPDVSVIFGVKQQRDNWNTFDVVEQGVRPSLIVEIVSPHYRVNDVETKFQQYHQAKVPLYVIVDRKDDDGPTQVLAYARNPRRYVKLAPDDDGRIWLDPVHVWIAARGNRVVCFDENDQELGDYATVLNELRSSARRADEEAKARAVAEERIRQLEELLKQRNGSGPTPGAPGASA